MASLATWNSTIDVDCSVSGTELPQRGGSDVFITAVFTTTLAGLLRPKGDIGITV